MLSVSAPVPAVVGTVIKVGKQFFEPIFGDGFLYSKSQRFAPLFTVMPMAFAPSMALPPPIAIMLSCLPERYVSHPAMISSSLGLGETPKNNLLGIEAF